MQTHADTGAAVFYNGSLILPALNPRQIMDTYRIIALVIGRAAMTSATYRAFFQD